MDRFLITPDLVYSPDEVTSVASVEEAVTLLDNNQTVVINSLDMAKSILKGLGYTEKLAEFRIDYAVNGCSPSEFAI